MTTQPDDVRPDSDAQLVERARKRDQRAYGQIVERYQSLVCSVAYNRCGDLTLSEDLAQEAFLLAWEKLTDLRDTTSFKAWICTNRTSRLRDRTFDPRGATRTAGSRREGSRAPLTP